MTAQPSLRQAGPRDDRVLPPTRWLAAFLLPFLAAASAILLLWPADTARLFAWPIQPPMTAMMLGSAYVGGLYFFARALTGQSWRALKTGFLPIFAFASLLAVATLLHWDRFAHANLSFIAWAGVYFAAPFLVLAAWLNNRPADPGTSEPGERVIPALARWILGTLGAVELLVGLALFLQPDWLIPAWPWKLTPLTARVVGVLTILPGLVDLGIALDQRWSAARISLEAQAFSILLILVSALRGRGDLHTTSPAAWLFLGGLAGLLLGILGLYLCMETRRR